MKKLCQEITNQLKNFLLDNDQIDQTTIQPYYQAYAYSYDPIRILNMTAMLLKEPIVTPNIKKSAVLVIKTMQDLVNNKVNPIDLKIRIISQVEKLSQQLKKTTHEKKKEIEKIADALHDYTFDPDSFTNQMIPCLINIIYVKTFLHTLIRDLAMEILDACYQLRVIESKKAIQQMLGEMPTDPDKFDAMMKQFYDENANDDPTPEMMKQFYDENANDDPTPELK